MATLSELQTRLETLKKARGSGALMVRHGDQSVTYRSLAEMEQIISELEGEIAALGGTRRRKIRYAYQSGKGL